MADTRIYIKQNEHESLMLLKAQRSEYSKAKMWRNMSFSITVLGTVVFTVLATLIQSGTISAFSIFFACIVVFIDNCLQYSIQKTVGCAAEIQQTFDTRLFQLPIKYGVMSDLDLAEVVNKYNDDDINKLKDWYSDYSRFPFLKQILFCQSENQRWDYKLKNQFRWINLFAGLFIVVIIVFIAIITKSDVLHLLAILAWCFPFLQYSLTQFRCLTEDIELLKSIKVQFDIILALPHDINERYYIDSLCNIQIAIHEHRKYGTPIPDWYYWLHKADYQEHEDDLPNSIAEYQTTLKNQGDEG